MLERMDDFFRARVDGYDQHMLDEVTGCREGYQMMAQLLPEGTRDLLDLGCGTGLELDHIFPLHPNLRVTGIDMTQAMLRELRKKHADQQLHLICGSYFDQDLGEAQFDAAISFETMHHFTPEKKRGLYENICRALRPGGCYIECDYMVTDLAEQQFYFAENERLRAEQGILDGTFYHYDTPCTIETQLQLFREAGFHSAQQLWRQANTTIIVAKK